MFVFDNVPARRRTAERSFFLGELSGFLVAHVIQGHLEQSRHMGVIQGVIDIFAFLLRANDLEVFQPPQLVGHCGHGGIQNLRQVPHTSFGIQKRLDDFDPRGVSQGGKDR